MGNCAICLIVVALLFVKRSPMKIPVYFFFTLPVLLSLSCKDDDDKNPPHATTACILQNEATTLSGNEASWTYEYNADGSIFRIKRFNGFGNLSHTRDIASGQTVNYNVSSSAVVPITEVYNYTGGNLHPTKVDLSITIGTETQVNYKSFFFFYDSKDRLYLVGEQTDYINGDLEWDLHITYNDQDNVTSLYYEITTGTAGTGSIVHVKAYDSNPTPFAGIPNWKFLMNNFAWDNYDPEPILTALSKNNPLDYALNEGNPAAYFRTMTYEYNEGGFPVKRTNTNKNASGEYTFIQTYSYSCK
jgi:hypothetical protein